MGSLFLFRPKGCMNSWKAKVGWAWNSRIWPNKLVATTHLRSLEKSSFRIILPPMSFTSELRSYSLHDSNAVRSYEIMSQNGRLWHVQGGQRLVEATFSCATQLATPQRVPPCNCETCFDQGWRYFCKQSLDLFSFKSKLSDFDLARSRCRITNFKSWKMLFYSRTPKLWRVPVLFCAQDLKLDSERI